MSALTCGRCGDTLKFEMASKKEGYTLTETVIAILVIGIVVAGVAGGLLGARRNFSVSDRKQQANAFGLALRETLKQYMIAYEPAAEPDPRDLAALDLAMRGFMGCPAQCHKLPGDNCLWALEAGCAHSADALLPAWFRAAPYNGTMSYAVAVDRDARSVEISVDWTEPAS